MHMIFPLSLVDLIINYSRNQKNLSFVREKLLWNVNMLNFLSVRRSSLKIPYNASNIFSYLYRVFIHHLLWPSPPYAGFVFHKYDFKE